MIHITNKEKGLLIKATNSELSELFIENNKENCELFLFSSFDLYSNYNKIEYKSYNYDENLRVINWNVLCDTKLILNELSKDSIWNTSESQNIRYHSNILRVIEIKYEDDNRSFTYFLFFISLDKTRYT